MTTKTKAKTAADREQRAGRERWSSELERDERARDLIAHIAEQTGEPVDLWIDMLRSDSDNLWDAVVEGSGELDADDAARDACATLDAFAALLNVHGRGA